MNLTNLMNPTNRENSAIPETLYLESLGHAAGTYQRDPREIAFAVLMVQLEKAQAAGREFPSSEAIPALRLNDVAYYYTDEIADAIRWLSNFDAMSRRKEAEWKEAKEAAKHAN